MNRIVPLTRVFARPAQSNLRTLAPSRFISLSSVSALDYVPTRNQLPEEPLEIGAMQRNRLREHYERTLATDMMYMMYDPDSDASSIKDTVSATTPRKLCP